MHMPYDDPTRNDPPIYVVMESNLLIAEDITGALQAFGPCQVIRIATLADLTNLVDSGMVVSAAFLELHYAQAMNMGVASSFALRGARIILTVGESDEAAVQDHGWAMLVRPFTEDMIHAVLQSSVREA